MKGGPPILVRCIDGVPRDELPSPVSQENDDFLNQESMQHHSIRTALIMVIARMLAGISIAQYRVSREYGSSLYEGDGRTCEGAPSKG